MLLGKGKEIIPEIIFVAMATVEAIPLQYRLQPSQRSAFLFCERTRCFNPPPVVLVPTGEVPEREVGDEKEFVSMPRV